MDSYDGQLFSAPSITPLLRASYTSPKAIGVALAPMALTRSIIKRAFLNADFHAFEVTDRFDFFFGVVKGPLAGFIIGQAIKFVVFRFLEQFLAGRAVEHLPHVFLARPDVGQAECFQRGNELGHRRNTDPGHVQGAELNLFDDFLFALA